jgi:hypothetical protein
MTHCVNLNILEDSLLPIAESIPDSKLLASWVQRGVARPVLRALDGDVLQ